MCRGIAVLLDKKGRVICKGISSHSETANTSRQEDEAIKYEIIVTDRNKNGYAIEPDESYEGKELKEAKGNLKTIKNWVQKHETQVLRWLLHIQSYAYRKGNTDNSYQKTKGNTYNFYQKTKGNTDNSFQETEGNTYNFYQKTEGNTYNSFQKTEGNTDNSYQETEGDTYNIYQETEGEWYLGLIKLKKYPNTTKLIKTAKENWNLTITELIRWILDNPDKAKKIMGNEGK